MSNPKIKICCISSQEEARMAIQYGATALGLVGPMPSGPGVLPDAKIAQIAAAIAPPTETFLLTSETNIDAIVHQHQQAGTTTIQLVDALVAGTHADLRNELDGVKIIQVIHVVDEWAMDQAMEIIHQVDGILLDSGNPKLAKKQLGGTGRTHDWEISRKIVEFSPIPVYLAGGLTPFNVQEAIQVVKPYGVDICSGVRTEQQLDEHKLSLFVQNIKAVARQEA